MSSLDKQAVEAALRRLLAGSGVVEDGGAGRIRLSPDLRTVVFVPYHVRPGRPNLSGVTVIPAIDGTASRGVLGAELVSPDNRILGQASVSLASLRSLEPAPIHFPPIQESGSGVFAVRVFVRDASDPVRIVERRVLWPARGLRRYRVRPIVGLQFAGDGPALDPGAGALEPQPAPPSPPPAASGSVSEEYERQKQRTAEVWSKKPAVKSLWQSKIYYETTMRQLTRGTAPHYMNYIKQNYFAAAPAASALSVGCGLGDLDRTGHQAGVFSRCLGLDVSDGALQTARQLAAQLGLPLEYETADLNNLTLRGRHSGFELIFANASLHHVANLERLLYELESVLAPGGLFFLHEYAGPSRFQWKPKTVEICDRLLKVLPKRLRGDRERIERMTHAQFMNGDPSEAVHSEEIMSLAQMFFDPVEVRDGGTTLTHPLLNDIMRYFDEDDETEAALLRTIFLLEEILIEEQVIESDTKLGIFRKRTAR